MIIDKAQLKRRNVRRLAGIRDRKVYLGPEVFSLEVTDACNLSCRYCWIHAPGNPHCGGRARFFPWEKFLRVVGDCVDLKVDHMLLSGSGEPTLHPLFRKMMRHLEPQPIFVKLLTNGTFPAEYCTDVIKADHVMINLSACDRQQYRYLQGKDLFNRVVKNIERLVALRDASKPKFLIEIAHIVNAVNVHQQQKMRDLSSRLGVSSVFFKKMNVNAYNREVALPQGVLSDAQGEKRRTPPACLNGWFYMAVKLDGSVSTCCRIPKMPVGDFDKMTVKSLWSSKRMMNVRLLGKYGQIQNMFQACQTCPFYEDNLRCLKALAALRKI